MSDYVIGPEYPSIGRNGELTFAGILRKYFEEDDETGNNIGISRHWNADTKATYIRDYEKRLLPVLKELYGEQRPISEISGNDFERCLGVLSDRYHYSSASIDHYRHLIWAVYRAGYQHEHYVDSLFWGDIAETEGAEELEKWRGNLMTRIRKSLSITEEKRLIEWMQSLDAEAALGEEVGALLTFWLGLRNNEACGVNYGSLHHLTTHPEVIVCDIVQSTKLDSNDLKIGGKTGNAPRQLIMLEPLVTFLQRRKDYLKLCIDTGKLTLPDNVASVDLLPIVCKGKDYTVRASSRDLTKNARELFRKLGIKESELAALYKIIQSDEELTSLPFEEKEPTVYLLRRNMATHIYQLGFSSSELQYWMGHEIEEAGIGRSFFADPDRLYELYKKLLHHPALTFFKDYNGPQHTGNAKEKTDVYYSGYTESIQTGTDLAPNSQILYHIKSSEPLQNLHVHIKADIDCSVSALEFSDPSELFSPYVRAHVKIENAYRNHK